MISNVLRELKKEKARLTGGMEEKEREGDRMGENNEAPSPFMGQDNFEISRRWPWKLHRELSPDHHCIVIDGQFPSSLACLDSSRSLGQTLSNKETCRRFNSRND